MSASLSMKAFGPSCTVGEAPHWQQEYGALVYLDIPNGKLYRYFPKTGRQQELTVEEGPTGNTVSFVLPVKGRPDLLLIGHGRDLAAVKWPANAPDSSSAKAVVLTSIDKGKKTRFNDGKCDAQGRVWAGTMGPPISPGVFEQFQGTLFRFSSSLQPASCVEKATIANGLGWSLDCKTFYFIDTPTAKVDAFDFNADTGALSNRRTVIDYKKETIPNGNPDGMTIDANGNIWVANFGGHMIICIDPVQKKILRKIDMPSKNMTSLCFGGEDFSTLYATSAAIRVTPEELVSAPDSGRTFEIKGLGVKGQPPAEAVIDSSFIAKI